MSDANIQAYSKGYGLSDTASIAEQRDAITVFIDLSRLPHAQTGR